MSDLLQQRRAGVLLHPTSLPSSHLNGDVERWLDWMAEACLGIWQMLPLVIPDHTGSPYQSRSALAANPALLDAESLQAQVDPDELAAFEQREQPWLPDFACFEVLRQRFPEQAWSEWPQPYRNREPAAMQQLQQEAASDYQAIIRLQFLLYKRWQAIRDYAAQRNILLFGDMPIFVALNSVDVWANQDEFLLDVDGNPELIAGVPPDYFSETGQRWGNPHYNWQKMQETGFRWWKTRLQRQFEWYDIVRLDHFRGLEASWMIPAECETAIDGYWQKVPGEQLLAALRQEFPGLPIVAEDLGVITPEVTALRKQFSLPGMSVLQFAFDAFEDNPHKPQNITADQVAYSGTHDNDTTRGWFDSLQPETQAFVYQVLQGEPSRDVVWLMLERLMQTQANLAIAPLQDILGLGSEARMNTPGLVGDNWLWRFDWQQLQDRQHTQDLRNIIQQTGRCHAT